MTEELCPIERSPEPHESAVEHFQRTLVSFHVALANWKLDCQDPNRTRQILGTFAVLRKLAVEYQATHLQEISWAVSNLFNRILDGTVSVSPEIVDLLDDIADFINYAWNAFGTRTESPDTERVDLLLERVDLAASGGFANEDDYEPLQKNEEPIDPIWTANRAKDQEVYKTNRETQRFEAISDVSKSPDERLASGQRLIETTIRINLVSLAISRATASLDTFNETFADALNTPIGQLTSVSNQLKDVSTQLNVSLLTSSSISLQSIAHDLKEHISEIRIVNPALSQLDIQVSEGYMDSLLYSRIRATLTKLAEHVCANSKRYSVSSDELNGNRDALLHINIRIEASDVVFEFVENQSPIHIEALKTDAISFGILSQTHDLILDESAEFIFSARFTSEWPSVTDLHTPIEGVGGRIAINCKSIGTLNIQIKVPQWAVVVPVLPFQVDGDDYAISTDIIQSTLPGNTDCFDVTTKRLITNGYTYDVWSLNDSCPNTDQNGTFVLISANNQHLAVKVDHIEPEECMISPLGITRLGGFYGGFLRTSGKVCVLLNPIHLKTLDRDAPHLLGSRRYVLVLDPVSARGTLVTQILLKNEMEADLALDVVDASRILQERLPHVVLVANDALRNEVFKMLHKVSRSHQRRHPVRVVVLGTDTGIAKAGEATTVTTANGKDLIKSLRKIINHI